MYSTIISFAAGFLSALLIFLLNYIVNRRRELRDREFSQLSNIKGYYNEEYLSQAIKDVRDYLKGIKNNEQIDATKITENRKFISRALNRIGTMAYSGIIPLDYILLMNAYGILIDWTLVGCYIYNDRGQEDHNCDQKYWNYRFAEWLALISWIWLNKNGFITDSFRNNIFLEIGKFYGGEKAIRNKEKFIFNYNKDMLSPMTRKIRSTIRK